MYTILMPIDRSEARVAAQVGAATDLPDAANSVSVTLLHIFDDPETAATSTVTQLDAGETAWDALGDADVEVDDLCRSGDPATEILAAAEDVDADMILLGGRKRSPLGSILFGSVTQEVTLDATRPVVVTGGVETSADPSHRCQSCGEEYFTNPDVEITECRNCGGAKVERVE